MIEKYLIIFLIATISSLNFTYKYYLKAGISCQYFAISASNCLYM